MILKIVTVIQARTGSTRLPKKVLLSVANKPLLLHMVERVEKADYSGIVVVATTTEAEDNDIEELCNKNNIECFRGHPTDLLDRHYKVAEKYDADIVVKIPSDCPLVDPNIIDKVISYFLQNLNDYDFVTNLQPPSYPDGNDVEVMSFESLKYAWKEAKSEIEREHTTPFIWSQPEIFRIGNVIWDSKLNFSDTHRWTLDFEEDYTFIRLVYEELYNQNPNFGLYDILKLLQSKPYLSRINNQHIGKFWYKDISIPKLKVTQNEK